MKKFVACLFLSSLAASAFANANNPEPACPNSSFINNLTGIVHVHGNAGQTYVLHATDHAMGDGGAECPFFAERDHDYLLRNLSSGSAVEFAFPRKATTTSPYTSDEIVINLKDSQWQMINCMKQGFPGGNIHDDDNFVDVNLYFLQDTRPTCIITPNTEPHPELLSMILKSSTNLPSLGVVVDYAARGYAQTASSSQAPIKEVSGNDVAYVSYAHAPYNPAQIQSLSLRVNPTSVPVACASADPQGQPFPWRAVRQVLFTDITFDGQNNITSCKVENITPVAQLAKPSDR